MIFKIWEPAIPDLNPMTHNDLEQTICAKLRKNKRLEFIIWYIPTYDLDPKLVQVVINPYGKYDNYCQLIFSQDTVRRPYIMEEYCQDLYLSWSSTN